MLKIPDPTQYISDAVMKYTPNIYANTMMNESNYIGIALETIPFNLTGYPNML